MSTDVKIKTTHFCGLSIDEKGFEIIKEYLASQNSFFGKDNERQMKEIEQHMYLNHISDATTAGLDWIQYAESFRKYLNTLKILWAAHVLEKGNDEAFDFEEYSRLVKNWPLVRGVLEGIY